jgi:DNA ligase (NAD+)
MKYDANAIKKLNNLTKQHLENGLGLFPEQNVEELVELLKFHEYRYYVLNQPLISDYEYDLLYKALQQLEVLYPHLVRNDSPTQRVASDVSDDFPSVPHITPMLSLENSYDEADLKDFEKQVRKFSGIGSEAELEFCTEPKFDGGTIVLVYENDLLVRGATRGNGIEGEDISNNVRAVKSIPVSASFSSFGIHRVELRGEALIRKDNFNKINTSRAASGLPLFANPRNAATGALRVKESREIQARAIEVFIYQISAAFDSNGANVLHTLKSHYATLTILQQLGFKVPVAESRKLKRMEEVEAYCREWESKRDAYEYEIDGMVIKADLFEIQDRCGSTSHHPRWAVAFKFKAKQASSKLLGVDFQVGKTGAITPVAKIAPVALAGVTISSISMHNEEFIMSRDLRIGDQVLVERAGDVIPYIVKSFPELRTGEEEPIAFPENCPSCSAVLVKPEGEAVWRCVNLQCPAQTLQRIIHHVSKDGMDIEGFGRANVERFYELGWLSDIADVYYLDFAKIEALDGFGVKSAIKLREAIEQAKKVPISKLLQSLSIRQLGKRAAQLIAANIDNIKDLYHWNLEQYVAIKEVGPILAENMMAFFQNKENQVLLSRLEDAGLNFESKKEPVVEILGDTYFSGKKVLFTGSMTAMGRSDAQQLVEKSGGTLISAVSGNLNVLVCGENAGSKLKKAQAIGTIEIMDEARFLEIMQTEGWWNP